jgi:hypothetical protein
MGMESLGNDSAKTEIEENTVIKTKEEGGNEFTVEQRERDIKEMIEKLSKKNFGFGFNEKNKLKLSGKIIEMLAEKYHLWLDILISPGSKEDASPKDKRMTKRVTDFFEVYDSDIAERALDQYFAEKK